MKNRSFLRRWQRFLQALLSLLLIQLSATAAEHWENRASGISRRTGNSAVWTGREMIVFGGGSQSVWLGDGGRYDLESDTWRTISLSNAPSPRWFHQAVWSGSEMIVWGGRAAFSSDNVYNDGARYNPTTDSWTSMSSTGAPSPRSQFCAVWTGTEMIVWGGAAQGFAKVGDGARYNPATDSWTPMSNLNAPAARMEQTAVWTGHEMIVWGGLRSDGSGDSTVMPGARYNPDTDTWTALPTNNAPTGATGHIAVWTGTDMIVWGGRELPSNQHLNTGARYNLAADTWFPVSTEGAPSPRSYHGGVWTGREMIAWGGIVVGPNPIFNDGARYNPSTDSWSPMTQVNTPYRRQFWRPDLGIWTGQGFLFYGGSDYPYELDSTAYYIPPALDVSPSIVTQPHDLTRVEGQSALFNVVADGSPPLTYQWSFNGNVITGATAASFQLENIQSGNAGVYAVTVANGFGSVTSREARLTVQPPIASFDVSAQYSTNQNPAGPWSYGWKSTVGGDFHLFTYHGYATEENGAIEDYWLKTNTGPSSVYHNPGTITITNNNGQGIFPPGTVWMGPGYDGLPDNFGAIRFTVPAAASGTYRIDTAVHTHMDGPISSDSDFHIVHNGSEVFGRNIEPSSGTEFSWTARLSEGDTIDFLSGRGADGQSYASGLKLQAHLIQQTSTPPVPGIVSFTPTSGPTGTVVTIDGHGFSPNPEANIVYFGGLRGVVTASSARSITAVVPGGATFGPVTVTVDGLTAASAAPFHVTFPSGTLDASAFIGPGSITPGDGPIATALADLDGDGSLDLAIANFYSDAIAVYGDIRGQGFSNAGIVAKQDFATGHNPWDFVLADINGDGKLDAIAANLSANTVSVLRNISTPGHIAFAPHFDIAVGASPHQVVVGDLDGDGRPDILVVNYDDGTLSVLRNTSESAEAPAFAPRVDFPTGPGPHGLGIADLDGDGKLDVVVPRHVTTSATTLVLRNTSEPGAIDSHSLLAVADLPGNGTYVAFGDLDGDGKLDLVIPSWYSQNVSVFRNHSSPGNFNSSSFDTPIILSSPGSVKRAAIADLDGDGRLDIAFPTEMNSALCFYQNVGSGVLSAASFGPRVDLRAGWNGDGISIGDVDLNGKPDLVFCNFYDDTVFIYYNVTAPPRPPVITAEPESQTVTAGSTVTFFITHTGSWPFTYQWFFDGVALPQATSSSLILTNVHSTNAGSYSVRVSNSAGSVLSRSAVLTVTEPAQPPTIVSTSPNQTVNAGASVTFSVEATGTAPLAYQWSFNSTNLLNATSSTLVLNSVQPSQAGSYRCRVSNVAGSVLSAAITLTVTQTNVPPHVTIQGFTQNVGVGSNATLRSSVTGTPPFTYRWFFNGVPIEGANANTLVLNNVQFSQAGAYWLTVNNDFGAATSLALALNVTGQTGGTVNWGGTTNVFIYDVDGVTRLPAGGTYLAQLYGGPDDNSLAPVGGAVGFSTPGRTPSVVRTITTVAPGQAASVQIRAWESAYGPTYEQALANGAKTGASLIVHVTTGGGGSPPALPAFLTGLQSFSLVPGHSITPPEITQQPVSQSVLLGSNAIFTVSASGGQLQYQWQLNGHDISGANSATLQIPNVQSINAGNYTVVVRNTGGSVSSGTAVLTVIVERTLLLGSALNANEGDLISVPLQLISQGDVGGLDFLISYNPDYLGALEVVWDSSLDGALKEFNVPTVGQLRGAIALPATSIPAGTQTIATLQFRARTVLADTTVLLQPQIIDIFDDAGDPIPYGSDVLGSSVGIADTGSLAGDNNGNHRLDVGDASLVMRLIAQLDSIRTWDVSGNDLNQNQRLDSGDVIKVLRIIAGIDQPPAEPAGLIALAQPAPQAALVSVSEVAVLSPTRLQAQSGQLVTVQLRLTALQTPISGVSFTLDYPADAVRFQNAQSHRVGLSVPGNAVAVWNVAPNQNNYLTQNGRLKLALSCSTAWSANNAVLAEFTFEVQPGASSRYQWPITVTAVEVTGNGYNNRTLSGSGAVFIGRNPVAGTLANISLQPSGASFLSSGDVGADYRIDVSEDLVHWTILREISNHPGSVAIDDPAAAGRSKRFYRSVPLR